MQTSTENLTSKTNFLFLIFCCFLSQNYDSSYVSKPIMGSTNTDDSLDKKTLSQNNGPLVWLPDVGNFSQKLRRLASIVTLPQRNSNQIQNNFFKYLN